MLKILTSHQVLFSKSNYWLAAYDAWLEQLNLPPQTVFGLCGPPSVEYLYLLQALWQRQLIALPLNPRLPESQLQSLLDQAGASYCLGAPALSGVHTPAWTDLPRQAHTNALELTLADDQEVTLIATSGSVSGPKLALHSLHNHLASALGSAENIPLGADDRWLLGLPLFHVGGLAILFRCLVAQAWLALPDPDQPLSDAIKILRPTHLSLVPTQLQRLLDEPELIPELQACKAILLGGSAIPRVLIERSLELKLPIHTSYGSTEMSSQITCTPPSADLETLLTAGRVLPGRELYLADSGEIQVRGQTLFQGYYGQGLPLTSEGWFATRDRGEIDEQGRLRVLGRLDNMFISGGENIQPEEIEAALLQLPGINQAIVVPVEHPEFGQRPVAFVETPDWEPERWVSELRERLPGFKIPDLFYPWPKEQIGLKPSRQALQQKALNPEI